MRVGGREKALRSSLRVTSVLLGMIHNSDSPTLLGEVNKYQTIPQHRRGKHLADTISSRHAQRKAEFLSLRYLWTFCDGSLGRGHTLPICLFCRPVTKPYVRHMQRNNRISGKQLLKAYLTKKKVALLNLGKWFRSHPHSATCTPLQRGLHTQLTVCLGIFIFFQFQHRVLHLPVKVLAVGIICPFFLKKKKTNEMMA